MVLSSPRDDDGGGGDGDNKPNSRTETVVTLGACPLGRHRSIGSASSMFDILNEELLIDILKRLSLKPANRYKCVSKRWHCLISSSYFGRCYVRYHQITCSPPNYVPPFALYYQLKNPELHENPEIRVYPPNLRGIHITSEDPIFKSPNFSLSFIPSQLQEQQSQQLQLFYLASSNGLGLCSATLHFHKLYFVCNPLTQQWVALPPPPSCPRDVWIGFICHPYYTDDEEQGKTTTTWFKVVRIQRLENRSDTLKLEIFCTERGRWTEESFVSSTSNHELYSWTYQVRSRNVAVVYNGLLHWESISRSSILAYDPYHARFRTIWLPQEVSDHKGFYSHCFGECHGHLRYAKITQQLGVGVIQVWELRDYSSGEWSLVHSLSNQMFFDPTISVLSLHPVDGDIVYVLNPMSSAIAEYNMQNRVLKATFFHPRPRRSFFISMVSPFVLPCWPTPVPLLQQN